LKELAEVIPLDSYGRGCTPVGTTARTTEGVDWKRLVPNIKDPSFYQQKIAIMSTYRFAFALENSNFEDYMSEKLYHGLQAGNVLVVYGAPNVDLYEPRKRSWINALNYPNARELGEYILKVNQSESLYEEHMSYKYSKDPLNPRFLYLHEVSLHGQIEGPNSMFCRVLSLYSQLQGCE
jgi:hypothetical protein